MDVLSFRDYCLSLPLTEESTPFDETTLVYKIGGKMYACADMNDFGQVAVKCDPDEAVRLRERYEEIGPAYHFNKTHWNGIATKMAVRLIPFLLAVALRQYLAFDVEPVLRPVIPLYVLISLFVLVSPNSFSPFLVLCVIVSIQAVEYLEI